MDRNYDEFSRNRAEWVAAGRPVDESFAHWRDCVEQAKAEAAYRGEEYVEIGASL